MAGLVSDGLHEALEVERRIEPRSNVRAAWEGLFKDARSCTRCDLYKCATQTVFGEGPLDASIVFVGEQPGDQEDLAGRPFVGPAGAVFDAALEQAGIDRSTVYVTNAVKHFKWTARGKRRIHQKPAWSEIAVCRSEWLDRELAVIRPQVLVCLGATAAQALLGKQFRVTRQRGTWVESELAPHVTATIHPSAILRQRSDEDRHREMDAFVQDLGLVASVLSKAS
jgi:uracil-DNA glycosylase